MVASVATFADTESTTQDNTRIGTRYHVRYQTPSLQESGTRLPLCRHDHPVPAAHQTDHHAEERRSDVRLLWRRKRLQNIAGCTLCVPPPSSPILQRQQHHSARHVTQYRPAIDVDTLCSTVLLARSFFHMFVPFLRLTLGSFFLVHFLLNNTVHGPMGGSQTAVWKTAAPALFVFLSSFSTPFLLFLATKHPVFISQLVFRLLYMYIPLQRSRFNVHF